MDNKVNFNPVLGNRSGLLFVKIIEATNQISDSFERDCVL